MSLHIGITPKNLKKSAAILATILSNEMTLYVKTRKFHWNISGNSFMELHKLFEDQYRILEANIDDVAERISQLGEKTIGTMKEFVENSTLKESPNEYPSQKQMLEELLGNHEQLATEFRAYIPVFENENNDIGSADLLRVYYRNTKKWLGFYADIRFKNYKCELCKTQQNGCNK